MERLYRAAENRPENDRGVRAVNVRACGREPLTTINHEHEIRVMGGRQTMGQDIHMRGAVHAVDLGALARGAVGGLMVGFQGAR